MNIRKRRYLWIVVVGLTLSMLGTVAAGLIAIGVAPQQLTEQGVMRRPSELIRYAKRRLQHHNKLEYVLLPPLHMAQRYYERPTDGLNLPNLGKGQQPPDPKQYRPAADIIVTTPDEILSALKNAKPGQIIEIAVGKYRFNQSIKIGRPGLADAPITVRAAKLGAVVIELNTVEGFLVNQPFWVFEDLTLRGVCESDYCEHAFHIVGNAEHTALRNNYIEDFNAHIKVNGLAGFWPDHGLLSHNTLTNTRTRPTRKPVTPFDLVGASYWKVADNLVVNFVKRDGNQTSVGIFMKGASEGGRIERNLVICSPNAISQPGQRVGISFGGGGTSPATLCRDGNCANFEHANGLAANNIIAHCNDSGLDINNSSRITLAHNTLINTSGIDLRRSPVQARLYGNLFEGNVRPRDGAVLKQDFDQPMRALDVFQNADELNLQWLNAPDNIPSLRGVSDDFCRMLRGDGTPPGAVSDPAACKDKWDVKASSADLI